MTAGNLPVLISALHNDAEAGHQITFLRSLLPRMTLLTTEIDLIYATHKAS